MHHFRCDLCGKTTHANPPVESVMEEREIFFDMPIVDPKTGQPQIKDGKPVTKKASVKKMLPKIAKQRKQHPFTGEIREVDVPEVKDLAERAFIVTLSLGHEQVSRDFCRECLTKHVIPLAKPLWDKLASINQMPETKK